MTQPWIASRYRDFIFILSPPFLVWGAFAVAGSKISTMTDFYQWFILVVLIDVSHVYATLFKTYLQPAELKAHPFRYFGIPILTFFIAFGLYQFGALVFWRSMAYIALFHFIRQQYGFFKLYSRNENHNIWVVRLELVTIYLATLYPVCHWFCGPKRNFNWFVKDDFILIPSPILIRYVGYLYLLCLGLYLLSVVFSWFRYRYFNIPKNLVLLGTAISWYVGIVVYNDDLVFTAFNVVSHGVPYLGLVFFSTLSKTQRSISVSLFHKLHKKYILLLFLSVIFVLGIVEEIIWDLTLWHDHINWDLNLDLSEYAPLLVPALMVPQLTHYLLDGFIWKRPRTTS